MFVATGKNGKWKIVGYALIMYIIFYKKTHISKLEFGKWWVLGACANEEQINVSMNLVGC